MGVETTELTAEHSIASRPASAPCRIERLTLRVLHDLERLPRLRANGPRFGRQRFVVCESVSEDWKAPFDHLLGRGERKAEVAGKLTPGRRNGEALLQTLAYTIRRAIQIGPASRFRLNLCFQPSQAARRQKVAVCVGHFPDGGTFRAFRLPDEPATVEGDRLRTGFGPISRVRMTAAKRSDRHSILPISSTS
jgi:hypothetical protein